MIGQGDDMPSSGVECVGDGNKGVFISFVTVPMVITLRCHSYGRKHIMDVSFSCFRRVLSGHKCRF